MLRLSTISIHQGGVDAMLEQQKRVFESQLQISTGKRFVNPSDDPTAAAQVIGLSEALSRTEQHLENIQAATARLEREDSALSSVEDVLQRTRELAVRGLSDSLGADGRRAIAKEVRELRDELIGLGNTRDGNGDYLFAGSKVTTVPFVEATPGVVQYQGDQKPRDMEISPARSIATGDSGLDVFMKVRDPAGGYKDMFAILAGLASSLEANAPQPAVLEELDNALQVVSETRAAVGARLNSADRDREVNDAFLFELQRLRSETEDADIAEVASRLNQQMLVLQAAQQAFARVAGLSLFSFL